MLKFKFEFSDQMTQVIGEALANLPYRVAAPVITELQRQIDIQMEQRQKDYNARKANGNDATISEIHSVK